jgi:hypothetical protein
MAGFVAECAFDAGRCSCRNGKTASAPLAVLRRKA